MKTTHLQITGMNCAACVGHVSRALSALPGVGAVNVDLATGRATVEHEESVPPDRLAAAVHQEDYEATVA